MLYPMKLDVSVVFSASYVVRGVRLLIYALYNLKGVGKPPFCCLIMYQTARNKGSKMAHNVLHLCAEWGLCPQN